MARKKSTAVWHRSKFVSSLWHSYIKCDKRPAVATVRIAVAGLLLVIVQTVCTVYQTLHSAAQPRDDVTIQLVLPSDACDGGRSATGYIEIRLRAR